MSWIRRHPVLSLFLAAFLLRAGLSVLTEYSPLMPEYYFTDAHYADEMASEVLSAWDQGRSYIPAVSPAKRLQTLLLAGLYSCVGLHPLAAKLFNALIGALAVLVFFGLVHAAFGPRRAALASLVVAVWPSHVFMTSQNFKDGPVMLAVFLAIWTFLKALRSRSWSSAALSTAAMLAALILAGLQRSYLVPVLTAVFVAAGALAAVLALRGKSGGPRFHSRQLLCVLAAALAPFLYKAVSATLFQRGPLRTTIQKSSGQAVYSDAVPQSLAADPERPSRKWDPGRLSEIRRRQQISDQAWAQIYKGRRIGTQLFYGVEFHTWGEVLRFLPKSAFYVLFMPLPGLYPIDGNLGRLLASLENVGILVLALGGALGAWRCRKTPERLALLAFFCLMTGGSALLEFDLGSAARHKLLYLPMLFPFAFVFVAERRRPAKDRRKVLQVLECGGPGGTGNQVAALCNGLDPASFDMGLAYAVRSGRPQDYRDKAKGARSAFFIPELTREISPRKDLRAFLRLHRLFSLEAPDVVHTHSSKAGILGRLAAWLTGTPIVYHSPRGYGFLQQDRSLPSRLLYWMIEAAVSWIGEIMAVSPSEGRLARGLSWGGRVHVVPDPFLGKLPEASPDGHSKPVVAACGRLTYARNPEAFLRMARTLHDKAPGLRFLWIGGGELEKPTRSRMKSMGLSEAMEISGWLEPDQAFVLLGQADVFVHYSRWEGLPNAVLDAMAWGLPVVASDVPGNKDAVIPDETGLIAKDETQLADHCLKLIGDPDLRRRLGQAGRERVARDFSPAAAFAAVSRLYLL